MGEKVSPEGGADRRDLALTVARGNGKSALCAAIAAAVLDGPLRSSRAEVLLVASSFSQALVMFRDVLAFLPANAGSDRKTWRIRDSTQVADIEHRPSGARLRALGSNPAQMHGLRPKLVLADEPAQWGASQAEACLAALRTGLGKHPGSRLIALGTRPADSGHWFARMLEAPDGTVYAARDGGSHRMETDLEAGQPVSCRLPALGGTDPVWKRRKRSGIRSRSLPSGRSGSTLGNPTRLRICFSRRGRWREASGIAYAVGPYVLGIDMGQTQAMSAAAGYWPETGKLDALAVFGSEPDLRSRGLSDGVGRLYLDCEARGELLTCPGRVSDVKALLGEAWERWGAPAAIVADRWREGDLRDALAKLRFPRAALVIRGRASRMAARTCGTSGARSCPARSRRATISCWRPPCRKLV